MEKNKKTTILFSVIAIIVLISLLIGATYAYFNAQVGDPASADIKINANTVDTLTFSSGSRISFSINQDNFASGKGNLTGSTYASATLTANNKTNNATETYNLYLNIESNTFTYSIDENTPEIMMTIKNSDGTEVTTIDGFTHTTVTGANGTQVSGFDITNKNGLIAILKNKEITTTSTKTERWDITITFVNYNQNQNANAGKSLNAKVIIQKESNYLHESCSDKSIACHIAKLYTGTQGENNLYYHIANLTNGAGDNSYRYSGKDADVNNYVCFGSTASPCPDDNLYRIIGVFDGKVKLIKATSIGNMAWDSNNSNTWSTSSLNAYLNGTFLTSLGTYASKIAITKWKVGGNSAANIKTSNAYEAYRYEMIAPEPTETSTTGETEYSAKIGLMYVNDSSFTTLAKVWKVPLQYYGRRYGDVLAEDGDSWINFSDVEWMITRATRPNEINLAFNYQSPFLGDFYVTGELAVRPCFYLNSNVTYTEGTGTQSAPMRIS